MTQRYKVGDKVIPISKTVPDSTLFESCPHAQSFVNGEVKYLTVKSIYDKIYVCASTGESGNYYNESDLIPYISILEEGDEL